MKKLALLLCAGLIWSCNKQIENTTPKLTVAARSNNKPFASGDGAYDVLGYGYDVTGQYGNASAARFQVIDIARFMQDYPSRVETDYTTATSGALDVGDNAVSYSSSLSAHITATVGLKVFGGTITGTYTGTDAFSSNYIYGGYSLKVQEKVLKINAPTSLLINYLTPTFVSDLQTQTPAYIVAHYGTHILTDISLGGKLQVLYQAQTTSTTKTTAATAGVSANVGKIFDLNTGATYNTSSTAGNFGESLHYATYGGDPSKSVIGSIALGTQTAPTVDISTWQSSCTATNAQLIDIAQDGLISLSSLVADPAKSSALQTYINSYLTTNQVALLPVTPNMYPFPAQYNKVGFPYATSQDPQSFTKIGINGNKPLLTISQAIYSPNGYYHLTLQGDGNLVLYSGSKALWASNTSGKAAVNLYYQTDNNLVLYNSNNSQNFWACGIYDNNGTILRFSNYNISTDNLPYFALQNDGNLVGYWPAYTSDTHQLVYIIFASTDTAQGIPSKHNGTIRKDAVDFNLPSSYRLGSYFVPTP